MSFKDIQKQARKEWKDFVRKDRPRILIGAGTCGKAAGALEIKAAFEKALAENSLDAKTDIVDVGCLGMCYAEPLIEVRDKSGARVLYKNVRPGTVAKIVESQLVNGEPLAKSALAVMGESEVDGLPKFEDLPMIKPQVRVALRNCGHIDPTNINHYIANHGYESLKKILKMKPEEVIQIVEDSLLRGRGGAGFPTGFKWASCRKAPGDISYVICNGDEGDPGAFMDRSIMEGDPHSMLEGMIIAAWAVAGKLRKSEGYIYVRAEYPLAIENLNKAINQAREMGFLGKDIFGSGFDFDIKISQGAGAFVCGESSALMRSLEGRAGEPRVKYIRSVEQGLWDKPTNLNNVETYANVPAIIQNGAEWFTDIGVEKNGGTKVFSLSGKVKNTGLAEVPMGTTVRQVVFDVGGGILNDKKFKAVQTGGPSGGAIADENLDLPMTYEGLAEAGSMMGSGGMIVVDEETCMVDLARYFLEFSTEESCGKCIPCREGTKNLLAILERICAGKGEEKDLETLERLSNAVVETSLCGLGKAAPNPVISTLRYFRDEYEAHIFDKKCPAGVCRDLIEFSIDPDACTGCGVCLKQCPVDAITGEKKQPHTIDRELCIRCGACRQACKFDAVIVE